MAPSRPAVVLGSTQPEADVDQGAAARFGFDVARRRSGGGAVLVDPATTVWIDAIVPRDDELWVDDVGVAFEWFGRVWAATLADLGVGAAAIEVHTGALVRTALGPVVCFAGLGPGEVSVDGAKSVGLSQRRTRGAARFQSSLLMGWDPDRHAAVLAPGLVRVVPGTDPTEALRGVKVFPVSGVATATVVDAVLAHLPG